MPWWLVLTDDELKASYPAAYAYLKARKVELPADFYARFEALRPEAWTVGKLAQLESIETVKKSLLDALKSGASFEDWQKTAQKMDIFPKHYREVVFRNAMLSSYNSAKWASFRDNAQRFPVLRYSAINDGRTRPAHSAMHGLMMPVNDPRWQTLAPPSGHNCRCTLQSLTEKQAKAYGYKGAPDKLPTYIDNKGIEQTVQADKGWHHSPELGNLDELLREREQAAGMPAAIYKAPEISKPAPAPQIAPEVPKAPVPPKAPEVPKVVPPVLPDAPQGASKVLEDLMGETAYKYAKSDMQAPKIADKIRKHKLTQTEAIATYFYTGKGYGEFNAALRSHEISAEQQVLRDNINAALNKIPDYVGEVVRRVELPPEVLQAHQAGAIVTYDAFTSATRNAQDVFKHYPHRLVIQSKTGKRIDWLSDYQTEGEVLFRAPTRFFVTGVGTLKDGTIQIELQEIADDE